MYVLLFTLALTPLDEEAQKTRTTHALVHANTQNYNTLFKM